MDTQDKLRLGAKRVGGDLLDAVRKEKEEKSRAYEAWKFANRASNPETAERMWKQSAAGSVAEAAKDIMGTGKPVVRQKADRLSEARRGIYGKDKGGTGRYSDLKRVNSIMNLYDRYAEAYGFDEEGKVKLPSYAPDYGHALKESGLEDYIGMSREDVRQELDWLEYVDRYTGKSYKDTFWGNAKANYDMGRMDQDSSLAWNAYLAEQTEENRRKAETVDQLIEEVYLGNQAVYGDDGPLPWLSKTMANYLPQAIDQAGYAIGGGLLGAGVGALAGNPALGAKTGITAASGVYSYKTMQGAAFKNLVEAGYPEKLAAAAASDEALISAGIEMAGTAIDLATMFAGKGVNALTAGSLDKAMEALNKTAGKNAFTRFAAGLSKYGLNLSSEGLEEMLQEIVSIASERSPGQGKAELIKDSVEIIKAMLHGGDYSQGRVIEAGKEGVKIAAMMGGADAAANVAAKTVAKAGVNREYSAAYTPEQKRDIQTALVEEGLEIAPDSKEVQHAKKQLDQGKDLTGVQVRELVQANERAIQAQVMKEGTETENRSGGVTLESISQKYGDQAKAVEKIYEMGGGEQNPEKFGKAYAFAYDLGRSGGKWEYAKNSTATSYLTEQQRELAYQAGKDAAEKEAGVQSVQTASQQEMEAQMHTAEDAASASGIPSVQNMNMGGRNNETGEELHLRQGVQWYDSANPGGQVRPVEAAAGGVQNRQTGAEGRPGDGGKAAQTSSGRVSAADLGVPGGSWEKNLILVPDTEKSPALESARAVAKENDMKIVLFRGGSLNGESESGKAFSAKAFVKGDTMYVRADHKNFASEQLARHEAGHKQIQRGEISPKQVYDKLASIYMDTIEETLPDGTTVTKSQSLDFMIEQYAIAYAMTEYTPEQIFEEIVCDALADMNAFSPEVARQAVHFLSDIKNAAQEQREETKVQRTGPPDGTRYSIETMADGKKYVRADRQVIYGNDTESWSEQVEDYINGKIRRGQDVKLVGEDGDVLTLTATSAGKLADNHTSYGTTMDDDLYSVKANAAVHIDELVETSIGEKAKPKTDKQGRHGEFASGGWTYRTAYFRDFDGKYYRLEISAAINKSGTVVYNIGDIKERSLPTINGSSARGGALGGKTSSTVSISRPGGKSNNNSQKNEIGFFHDAYQESDGLSDYEDTPISNKRVSQSDASVKLKFSLDQPIEQTKNTVNSVENVRFSRDNPTMAELLQAIQNIGRKSVNSFTPADIKATEKFAQRYWKEMGTKSPFFRGWFGDWRVKDQTPVQIAKQKGDTRGIVRNLDTDWNIQVSGKVFNETKTHKSTASREALPYLPYINDIVSKAILLDSYGLDVKKSKSENSLLMHSMYAVADIGDGPEVLKLYVEEMNDPNANNTKKRSYQLQNIEKAFAASVRVQGGAPSSLTNTANAIHTVADLFDYVKTKDTQFHPNPTSKVVNSDGTPMVMYHGTRAENGEFHVFDESRAVKRGGLGLRAMGKGNYFTSKKLDGTERYGSRVIPAYLNIRNPFVYTGGSAFREQVSAETGIHANGMSLDDVQEKMRSLGYDGVIQYDSQGKVGIAVTFDSNQIKSAADNAGTFDGSNPDIRFSLEKPETDTKVGKKFSRDNPTADEGSAPSKYAGKELAQDRSLYTYDFLTSLPDMKVTKLPEVDAVRENGMIESKTVANLGMKNALSNGFERDGKIYVKNDYTGRDIRVDISTIRHSVNGEARRLLTNARLGAVAGDIVKNAVPINALYDTANNVTGTYAMAAYAVDSKGREFVAIVTVEQRSGDVSSVDFYDVAHAVSGRQKTKRTVDTESPGVYPYTLASNIKISDFLNIVKSTYQSILPEDVLNHFGEERNQEGHYADRVKFSRENPTVAELQRENTLLRQRLDFWRGQTKLTERKTVRLADVDKVAKETLARYQSEADFGKVRNAMKCLADDMRNLDTASITGFDMDALSSEDIFADMWESPVWDKLQSMAEGIAETILDGSKVQTNEETTGFVKDLRDFLKGRKISLGENKSDISDYNDFRKRNFGRFTLSDSGTPMDTVWLELQEQFGKGFFPEDITHPADQALYVEQWFNTAPEYANPYQSDFRDNVGVLANEILDDLFSDAVRDTAPTFADRQAQKLTLEQSKRAMVDERLKKTVQEMDEKIQKSRNTIEKLRKEKNQMRKQYQDSRAKSVEGRKKTTMRHKLQNDVKELNKLLNHGDKKRNVKDGIRDFATEALATAEFLFMDEYSNEDMVRAGVMCDVDARENKLLEETQSLLQQYDDIFVRSYAEHEVENIIAGDTESFDARMRDSEELNRKIAENMRKLNGVFSRERNRLNKATVSSMLDNLAKAYKKLGESDELYIRGAANEEVYQHLLDLSDSIGGTIVKDMNLKQLTQLHEAYTMVLTTTRNANRMFNENLKATREVTARRVMEEVQAGEKTHRKLRLPGQETVSTFSWNNTKPVYAMERLGSETLKRVYQAIRDGQDVYAVDMQEAKKFRLAQDRKHNRKGWNLKEQHGFRLASGEVSLNLEQIMSLYALSRRKEGLAHLLGGGFVFGKDSEVVVSKKGIPVTYRTEDATAYRLTPEELDEITGTLTPEQKAYAEEMQKFLSQVMGEKGNEISMQLYGIRSFQDEAYYPIRSAGQYMERAKAQALQKEQGQIHLVNAGFTKSTVPHAENPIVLDGFSDVWAEHVQEMSMYHGLALPLEDFRKVYNYRMKDGADGNFRSVNAVIENVYGKAATGYLDQLYKDLNANVVRDSREDIGNRLTGKFKKAAVMASASVVIQQFSALPRAFALIDPKYFVGTKIDRKRHNAIWEELKEYAPVAFIKEMGYFDTGVGLSGKEYLLQQEYGSIREKLGAILHDGNYRDELLGALPALADEMTWCNIWEAVKRETRKQHPEMKVNSPQFLETAGRRFSEIIDKTQVYDSVLSRSANMRGKTWYMNAITSFMAEPTTVVNMMEDALRKKDGKQIAKVSASVLTSQIMNALLVSLVYAARDDDEDKTWLEKYLSTVAAELVEGVNPVSYYPLLKDLWSLAQGYDVERPDMTLFGYAVDALNQLNTALEKLGKAESEEETAKAQADFMESMWGLADAAASLLGLPLKNIRRDVKGAASLVRTAWADLTRRDTTALSLQDAIWNEVMQTIPFFGKRYYRDKRDQLYRAMTEGDREYARRLEKTYASEDTFHGAVRTALREHDSRIWEAAVAWNEGNLEKYIQIAQKIRGENHFTQDDIVLAIRAEAESMLEKEDSGKDRTIGFFNTEKLGVALAQDNGEMVKIISEDLMDTDMRKGKTRDEAKEELESSVRGAVKKQYLDNGMERTLAIKQLTRYGDLEREEAAVKVECWDWLKANPDSSATEVQVEGYLKTRENGRSVQECGISMEVYLREKKAIDAFQADHDEKGASIPYSRINKAFPYIDSLTLTSEQKTAMALACGWELKTVERNKLW